MAGSKIDGGSSRRRCCLGRGGQTVNDCVKHRSCALLDLFLQLVLDRVRHVNRV